MARCEGIGGQGEPASFVCPAWINPDSSIVIDLSAPPKCGQKDVVGRWENDGIVFEANGTKWPMVPHLRDENLTNFIK